MYYIGIDLGGTNLKTSIFHENMSLYQESRVPTQTDYGANYVLRLIKDTIIQMLSVHNIAKNHVACVGLGVPGLLDLKNGISLFSPNFSDWENVRVVEYLQNSLQIPVFIDNDVRMNLYGEWYYGAGKGKENVVLLTIGTGLGSGVVMDNHVLYGVTASAGEIGHMNMYQTGGRPCKCGSSGCLGRYVSALGVIRTLNEKLDAGKSSIICDWVKMDRNKITAKMISEAYDLGDLAAIETLHETGNILGYGLVNIINLYNPEVIIIGGGVSKAGERLLQIAKSVVYSHALQISREACSIVTAELSDSAGMIGAAAYARKMSE